MSLAEKIKETFSKKAKLLQGHQPSRAPHLGHLSDDTRGNAKGGKSLSCLSLVKKITGKFSKGAKTLGGHRASRAPPSTPPDDIRADSKGDNKGGNLSGLSLAKGIKGMFSKRPRSWKSHRASRAPSTTHWPSPAVDTRGDAKGGIGSGTGAGSIRNGVLSVLRVVHASLDGVPVPGLKSVIGGFLEVVSQLERFGANADAIRQLQHNIELFVHSISEPLKQYGAKDPVPHGISRAIEAVSTEIAATTAPLQSYLDKNPAYLWANRDKIEGDVRLAGERIRGAVAAFQASQAIQVHIGMISMQKDVQIQFERLHGQIKAQKHDETLEGEARPQLGSHRGQGSGLFSFCSIFTQRSRDHLIATRPELFFFFAEDLRNTLSGKVPEPGEISVGLHTSSQLLT